MESFLRFLSERRTSWRRGVYRLNTDHQSIRDESARPTLQLFAICANVGQSSWERRSVPPLPIAHLPQHATHMIWSTLLAAAPVGPLLQLQQGWCRSLWELRPEDLYCALLPFVA